MTQQPIKPPASSHKKASPKAQGRAATKPECASVKSAPAKRNAKTDQAASSHAHATHTGSSHPATSHAGSAHSGLSQTAPPAAVKSPAPVAAAPAGRVQSVQATQPGKVSPVASAIKIRMYRQGLGDCFLVTIDRAKSKPFRMMIDCGVILGTSDSGAKLGNVIRNIISSTEDKPGAGGFVDVLVVTHEHYDHVAGFVLASDLFAQGGGVQPGRLAVGEVWFAWTEDPADATAIEIRKSRAERTQKLAALALKMNGMGMDAGKQEKLAGTLAFLGIDATNPRNTTPSSTDSKGGAGMGATARAMQIAAATATPKYWRPGEVIAPAGAPELRIYVLGPPQNKKDLFKTDAPAEVYHLDDDNLDATLDRAVAAPLPSDPHELPDHVLGYDAGRPFDPAHTYLLQDFAPDFVVKESDASAHHSEHNDHSVRAPITEFLARRYYTPPNALAENDQDWRRIDGEWLQSAEQLALALDDATNNTSLVLAIELVDSGKVLMFPGDAQAGNWLSWDSVTFKDAAEDVNATDLLKRTVFYKVGHHGSHNATMKQKGLERMLSKDLVAFIPVDHEMALKKHWGKMPLDGLLEALHAQCGNRVVRIDDAKLPDGFTAVQAGHPEPSLGGSPIWYEWTMPF